LRTEKAIERARAFEGLPFGVVGGFYSGVARARNQDLEAGFRAGRQSLRILEPGRNTEGFVFFDAPEGVSSGVSGAMIIVEDVDTREPRTLLLGDTTPCSGGSSEGHSGKASGDDR
jgi:hypothetical protein